MRVKAFIFVVLILLGGKIFTVDATEKHTIDIVGIELISPYRCNLTIGFKSWGDPFYSLDIRSPDLLYITNENINPKDYEDKSYITYTITSLFTDTDYEFVITSYGEFAAKSEILTFNSHDFLSKIQVNNNEIPRSGIVYYEPNRKYQFECITDFPAENFQWSFEIAQKEGGPKIIATGESPQFPIEIPTVEYMDKRNDDGDVICNIYCKTQYGGITYEINYPFFIRTYPDQPKIDILDVKVQDAQSCTLTVGFHAWDAKTYTIKIVDTNRDKIWEDNLEDNINNSYTTYTFDKIYIDTNYEITVWGFNGSKILMTQTLYFRMNDHMGIEKIEQDEFIESGTIFNRDAKTYTIKIVDTNRDKIWEDNLEDNINNSYTTYTFDKIYIDTNYEITVWGFNGSKILMTQTLYFRMNDHMGIEKIEQDEFIESGTIFNLQGQIIGRFTENHRDIFTELQPGIYIINGLTSTGKKVNRKIIVKSPSSPI